MGALRRAPRSRDVRPSSSKNTTPEHFTGTFAWNATACSSRGPCRRASRWIPTPITSPCTSKTTLSSTAPSRGRFPRASTGPARSSIWDHGTYDTEKWRSDEIMVVLHGKRARRALRTLPHRQEELDDPSDGPGPEVLRRHARDTIKPMLALAGELPKSDAGWAYEFKWDGVRAMVYVDGGRVRALTRNDKSLAVDVPRTARYRASLGLPVGDPRRRDRGAGQRRSSELLDVVETASRHLQIGHRETATRSTPASFFAFDLLYLEGRSLMRSALRRSSPTPRVAQVAGRNIRDAALDHQQSRFQGASTSPKNVGSKASSLSDAALSYSPGRATATGSR